MDVPFTDLRMACAYRLIHPTKLKQIYPAILDWKTTTLCSKADNRIHNAHPGYR
jgi:hypothetical protein